MLNFARNHYRNAIIALVERSARHAVPLLVGVVLVTFGLLYYVATHIAIDTDTENMLDKDLPFRKMSRQYDEAFPQLAGIAVIVIEGPSAGRVDDAADWIADRLTARPDLVESVYVPGAGPFFGRNGLLYLDPDALWEIGDRLAEAQAFLGTMASDPGVRGLFKMLERALDEKLSPQSEQRLARMFGRISDVVEAQMVGRPDQLAWRDAWLEEADAGAARRFIIVRPQIDHSQIEPAKQALDYLRVVASDPAVREGGTRARITGPIAMEGEELANVAQDAKIATTLSAVLVCLILSLGLRSRRLVFAILTTLFIGLSWTAAFATFAIGQLNLISVSFAVLFIGMGADFGLQFGMRYREESGRAGSNHYDRLRTTARGVGGSLTLAAVAASISFLAFAPTSYRGLAELGIISGASMFVALLANLTILPAILTLLRADVPAKPMGRNLFAYVSRLIERRRRGVLITVALATLGAAALMPRVQFDLNPVNLRDPTTESVATFFDLLKDPDTSPYTIDVLVDSLDDARGLAARLETVEGVDKVLTLASFVPEDQDQKLEIIADMKTALGDLVSAPGTGERASAQENATALTLLRERLLRAQATGGRDPVFASAIERLAGDLGALAEGPTWPESALAELEPRIIGDFPKLLHRLGELLQAGHVGIADVPPDLAERYVSRDGRARVEVYPKDNLNDGGSMRRFVATVRTVAPEATGTPVILVEASDAVIQACVQATLLALAATGILMAVVLRNVSGVLLVLLPLLLAIILTAASSVLLRLPLNLANIIAIPLLIGLNSAFGIYLVMRNKNIGSDVVRLFQTSTPPAVLFSALTTMVSFGSLAVARHPGMSQMGVLIGVALIIALVCALVVLPAVMAEIEHLRARPATRRTQGTAAGSNDDRDKPGGLGGASTE